MRAALALAGAAMLAACGHTANGNATAPDVVVEAVKTQPELIAKDGTHVFTDLYPAERPKALILLFHQAGSGKGEYATIAPRLVAMGYEAMAIDARAGGDLYGTNETAKLLGKEAGYLDAKQDLQAAIDWAKSQKLPVILWGSSYSSALVFPLAVENAGTVKAILSFSPGEYFDDKTMVERAAAQLAVPAYVTSASKPDEIEAASGIAHAVPRGLATQYIPKKGVHGSSTLIARKDPEGAAANWLPVVAFLKKVAP